MVGGLNNPSVEPAMTQTTSPAWSPAARSAFSEEAFASTVLMICSARSRRPSALAVPRSAVCQFAVYSKIVVDAIWSRRDFCSTVVGSDTPTITSGSAASTSSTLRAAPYGFDVIPSRSKIALVVA